MIPDGKPTDQPPTERGGADLPPAPPWTKHDGGSGEWGSQPWYARADDAAFKAAIEAALPVIEEKWPHAAEFLDHYLDNTGSPYRVHVESQVNIADRYNWDAGKETKIGPITISDSQMAALQTAGLAREFDITGASSVSTYDGAPR